MSLSASEIKLDQLARYVAEVCTLEPSVQGVVAIGSVAIGQASTTSDVDAVVFLDPLDLYAVPAEAVWLSGSNTYHSIFSDEANNPDAVSLDFFRVDLRVWSDPRYAWPEPRAAELATGCMMFDPVGVVDALIRERTHYSVAARNQRLDESITWLDQLLGGDAPSETWARYDSRVAFDRLNSAYDWLVKAVFALNCRWRPWRNREASVLLGLPWLPNGFFEAGLVAVAGAGNDKPGYEARVAALQQLLQQVVERSLELGVYQNDAVSEAFIRGHAEPGRAWNIVEWAETRSSRQSNGT